MDGRARVLVDTGGGSFLRFGEAGARFEDLELIALSHFHTDHSADLPALLKSGNFPHRERELRISGPASSSRFPGLECFMNIMLDPGQGSYRYLSGYLDGSEDLVRLKAFELDHKNPGVQVVYEKDDLKVTALGVPHGIVPTLAYRVEAASRSIVFGSDQKGSLASFVKFAYKTDVLVAHMAIPESAGRVAKSLHATPSAIGKMAAQASAAKLLLSHFMARSLKQMELNLEYIGQKYDGNTLLAEDLVCLFP